LENASLQSDLDYSDSEYHTSGVVSDAVTSDGDTSLILAAGKV